MIRKSRLKFILLAMTTLTILMVIVVSVMNIVNYHIVVEGADAILSLLSSNKGVFPQRGNEFYDRLPADMSPETPFEARYFTVFMDNTGSIVKADINQIISVDRSTAITFANEVTQKEKTKGFVQDYRYIVNQDADSLRISFLDCGRKLDAYRSFLYTSCTVALVGLIIMFFIIFVLSGKIIKPVLEAHEKQKQFITDAGHEIKTPLTIINANIDILEMDLDERNESLTDIKQQTKRLRSLTDNLILLSRMEESEQRMTKIEFPISEVVYETVAPFAHLAVKQGKEFISDIEPMLSFNGNSDAINNLVCLLLDNALKYSPTGGTIAFTLRRQGRGIQISAFNTTENEVKQSQLKYIFDRFYRTDNSRNSEAGGHGIGLSVAKVIVTAHGGKINAWTNDGHSFQINATLFS